MINAHTCQLALNVRSISTSLKWYESLGFSFSGSYGPSTGDIVAATLERPSVTLNIAWLVGRDSLAQLELIEFVDPRPKPQPEWSPNREGYGAISIVAFDFAGQLERFQREGADPLLFGSAGDQSMWIKDPDGIWVEILESEPFPARIVASGCERLSSIRAVTLTVRNLEKTKQFWVDTLGFEVADEIVRPFKPLPPALTGGASFGETILASGPVLVRLLEPPSDAFMERPADYKLGDELGAFNIALLIEDKNRYLAYADQLLEGGFRGATPAPLALNDTGLWYGYDRQGTSLEICYVEPDMVEQCGWKR